MQHREENTPAGGKGTPPSGQALNVPITPAPTMPGVADVLKARSQLKVDPRLLSTKGVLEVSNQLTGVTSLVDDVTDAASFRRFTAEIGQFSDGLLQEALYYAMEGAVALAQRRAPEIRTSKYSDPVRAYLGSLELLTARLDDHAGFESMRTNHAAHFHSMRWTEAWNAAVSGARRWEHEALEALSAGGREERTHIGKESNIKILMVDENRRAVGGFTTFHFSDPAPIAEFPAILERAIPDAARGDLKRGISPGPNTFASTFLNASEFPDQAIAKAAQVEQVVGVVPLDPRTQKVLFKIGIQKPQSTTSIDILRGQGWPTVRAPIYAHHGIGQIVGFGLPASNGNGLSEELFSATGTEAIGPSRAALAEMIGHDASRSIVLVLKDCISPQRASFFRDVLAIKLGTKSIHAVADSFIRSPGRAALLIELDDLIADGHIRADAAAELRSEVAKRQPEGQPRRVARQSDGDELRGGNPAIPLKFMSSLQTGFAGIGSGSSFGLMTEAKVTNPLKPPTIIVLYPCGIALEPTLH